MAGDQRAAALVALADDPWRRRDPVERLLDQALEERPLLLDHEHLVQAGGEAAERVLVERVEHPDLQDPHRRRVAEAEVHERLAQVVVGGARGDDPEPGAGPVVRDRVEPVQARVLPGKLEPDTGQRALELERLRREQVRGWPVHVGPAVPLEHRRQRRHAVEPDLDRGGRVGDRRHDLERRPQTRGARARDRVPAEIDDLLHAARREHRNVQRGEQRLRGARDRRRLARRIVAAQREHAATRIGADEVAVADRVGGAVDSRRLAVPDAEHAVEARAGQRPGELRAPHGRCGELLVDRRLQDQLVLGRERSESPDLAHESRERRAGIAGDQRGRPQPGADVGAMLIEQDSHQRLHAREEHAAFREEVAVLE